jgi:hypoxanthine phosphoribosyltransferase
MTEPTSPQPSYDLRVKPGSKVPRVLITRDELAAAVSRLAHDITRDYQGKVPLVIGILKGSFMFLADLVRLLDIPVEIDLVRLASYGAGTVSSGKVRMLHDLQMSVENRDILIVDDIVDTGLSLSHFVRYIHERKPASVRVCALLDKPSRREIDIPVDYVGIAIPDKFIVGYGIDCNEEYRNLCDICVVED